MLMMNMSVIMSMRMRMSVVMVMIVIMTVTMFMLAMMLVAMAVTMLVIVAMAMVMRMIMIMRMLVGVAVVVREVDIKLHTRDGGFFTAQYVQMVAVQLELLQLALQLGCVHAQVKQRANEHVTGDAAKYIEIECFHLDSATRALIWLAA